MFIFTVVGSLLFRLLIGSVAFLKSLKVFFASNMILKVSVFVIGLFVSAALSGEKEKQVNYVKCVKACVGKKTNWID